MPHTRVSQTEAAACATSIENCSVKYCVCARKETGGSSLVSFPVLKKENNGMTRTMKHNALPEGMALVETADGRWFAACATLAEIPQRVYLLEDPPPIPPALDSFHERGQGYDCREEALAACHAWREEVELNEDWRGLAARTELYPERTAWYLDEIIQLARGDDTPHLHCGISVQSMVLARGIDSIEVISATGDTPDEAIESHDPRVYEWSRKQQAIACVHSLRSH
jgi:hypothetical protein